MNKDLPTFGALRERHPSDDLAAKQWLEARIQKAERDGIFTEVVEVIPPLAREFLNHNRDNRAIRPAKLKQFADDLDGARWDLNGEPMIFSAEGALNDGQHRNQAVIQTGRMLRTVIVFGVTRESRRTIDNGAARSPGDHLSVEGVQYAVELASIARFVLAWERGGKRKLSEMNRVTAIEIVDRALEDKAMQAAACFSKGGYNKAKSVAPPSVLGFCYYAFSQIDMEKAGLFLRQIVTGANLSPKSPAYVVRERLIGLDRPLREHRAEIIFNGWLAYIAGKEISRIHAAKNELPDLGPGQGSLPLGDPSAPVADAGEPVTVEEAQMEMPVTADA